LFLILHINIIALDYFVRYFSFKLLKKLLLINNIVYIYIYIYFLFLLDLILTIDLYKILYTIASVAQTQRLFSL